MPYSKEEIDRFVEEIGTPERLRERLVQATGEEALSEMSVALQRAVAKVVAERWRKLADRLMDIQSWAKLAEDPKSFNTELERVLADLRRWMKSVHGIPSHKPKKNTLRDREMFELRRLGKSFGEIGLKFKVSSKAAERACKRYEQAQKELLRKQITFFLDVNAAAQSSLSRQEESPPKPE